ncbi:phosphodiester glycosidase family protein [Cyclobacterium xiamenense]|uniref:phosphodiester glycosidase family protein n=1 Tax=Cyclobacterium xiamenense TaxID=1297121 RepID=UPI0035D08531
MRHSTTHALLWLLLFIPSVLFAQLADSIAIVTKEWKATPIKRGVVWKKGHFEDLFQSQQEINFVEIDLKKHGKKLGLAADSSLLKKTSQFAAENQAIVAINGGFFDMKNGGSVDYIKVKGTVINNTRVKTDRGNALLMLSKKTIAILPTEGVDYENSAFPNVLLSGPLLLQQGKATNLEQNAFNKNRHPRSALALTKEGKLLLLVVDGRNARAQGMRLEELAKVLRWLGARDAMNLDGGGSSSLYVNSKTKTGLVNHPSDNGAFDPEGERPVANILYLK